MRRRLFHWQKTSKRRSLSGRPAEVAMLEAGQHGQLESRVLLAANGLLPITDVPPAASAAAVSGPQDDSAASTGGQSSAASEGAAPDLSATDDANGTDNTFGATDFAIGGAGSPGGVTISVAAHDSADRFGKDKAPSLKPATTVGDTATVSDTATASDHADHAAFWADALQIDLLLSDQTRTPTSGPTTSGSTTATTSTTSGSTAPATRTQADPSAQATSDSASSQPSDRQHVSKTRPMAGGRTTVPGLGNPDSRVHRFQHSTSHPPLLTISFPNWRPLLQMLRAAGLTAPQADADGPIVGPQRSDSAKSHAATRGRPNSAPTAKLSGWLQAPQVPHAWQSRDALFTGKNSDEGVTALDWADSPQDRQREDSTSPRRHLWAGRGTQSAEVCEQPLRSDSPPEPPETDSEINWFQTLCHPRGPPDSESHLSTDQRLCGHSSVLQQLRHRIAPRGPSLAHFTDCERAIQIPHEAECSR